MIILGLFCLLIVIRFIVERLSGNYLYGAAVAVDFIVLLMGAYNDCSFCYC